MEESLHSGTAANDYVHFIQRQVRFAKDPDSPWLITHFLDIDTCHKHSFKDLKHHYERQFRLLLETVADELLPGHWRCCCLDNIHKPLSKLAGLFKDRPDEQAYLGKLRYELNMTCHYVLPGLTH